MIARFRDEVNALVERVAALEAPSEVASIQTDFVAAARRSVDRVGAIQRQVTAGGVSCGQQLNDLLYGLRSSDYGLGTRSAGHSASGHSASPGGPSRDAGLRPLAATCARSPRPALDVLRLSTLDGRSFSSLGLVVSASPGHRRPQGSLNRNRHSQGTPRLRSTADCGPRSPSTREVEPMPYLDCPNCRLTVYVASSLQPLEKCPRCGRKPLGVPARLFRQVRTFQRAGRSQPRKPTKTPPAHPTRPRSG
jgi:hypothetical protein